jgi:SAM-dependent methyltransferase
VRRFDADYLAATREGMWDDRSALAALSLGDRKRILDVGCGTGELSRVLAAESPARVVGLDRDPTLLARAREVVPVVRGDAHTLPFGDDAVDLVTCQALLINLPDPERAVREFARVSSDLVAVVEPDNSAVTVESTVAAESGLARRARERYLDGIETDVTLGAGARDVFEAADVEVLSTTRHDQVRWVEPPYSEAAVEAARRKLTGESLASDRETILSGATTEREYDELRAAWKSMGRDVVAQMREEEYERRETIPFFVTVGRVRGASEA